MDCFNCRLHENNLIDEFARMLSGKTGVPVEVMVYSGCRQQDGTHWHLPPEGCAALACVMDKGIDITGNILSHTPPPFKSRSL